MPLPPSAPPLPQPSSTATLPHSLPSRDRERFAPSLLPLTRPVLIDNGKRQTTRYHRSYRYGAKLSSKSQPSTSVWQPPTVQVRRVCTRKENAPPSCMGKPPPYVRSSHARRRHLGTTPSDRRGRFHPSRPTQRREVKEHTMLVADSLLERRFSLHIGVSLHTVDVDSVGGLRRTVLRAQKHR